MCLFALQSNSIRPTGRPDRRLENLETRQAENFNEVYSLCIDCMVNQLAIYSYIGLWLQLENNLFACL